MRPMKIPKQHICIALAIVFVAFFLRVSVLTERVGVDETFLPELGDIAMYQWDAQAILRGESSLMTFQPAIRYYYALGMVLMRGDNPYVLAVWVAWMDALFCGAGVACGWLLMRHWWAGQAVGLLMALYPVSVFYATVLMIESLAAGLSVLFIFLWLWQRERVTWWRTLGLGVLAGIMVHTRLNLAPLLGVYWLWLLFSDKAWRVRVSHTVLSGVVALMLFVAIYTPNAVGYQLYSANNRDGDGTGGASVAYSTVDIPMEQAIWRDIALDPVRFGGLLVRKLAIAWSSAEVANVSNYHATRTLSPTLQRLAGDFTPLAFFSLLGVVALWRKERNTALGFLAWFAVVTLGILVSFALSRFRYPITPALILLSVYGARALVQDTMQGGRAFARAWALPLIAVTAGVVLFPAWALGGDVPPVPPKRTYTELPSDARTLGVVFDDTLELIGWRTLPQWQAPIVGYAFPRQAYTIELFWRLVRPTPYRYSVTLNYAPDNERVAGTDYPIGAVSYPAVHTHRWEVGAIHAELIGFLLPADTLLSRSGEVRVGVYRVEGEDETPPQPRTINLDVTAPYTAPYVVLETLAVYDTPATDTPDTLRTFTAGNGDTLALVRADLATQYNTGETVTLTLAWVGLTDITRNYRLFLHVGDAQTPVITQGDGLPIATLLTSNWLPKRVLEGQITLPLPAEAGIYTLYYGLIDETGERMTTDAPDNRPVLGEITLR